MTMALDAHQRRAPSLRCDDALRIARQDAEAVYRELDDFQITVQLKDDGWHIDFDLHEPLVAGGGPHYLIDAQTGTILQKRYEQ